MADDTRTTPRRRRLLIGLAACLLIGLAEAFSFAAAAFLNRSTPLEIYTRNHLIESHVTSIRDFLEAGDTRTALHPVRGWTYRADFASGRDTINAAGVRAAHTYPDSSEASIRIAAFGDSFVYCNEVTNADCWTAFLESSSDADVMNFGVGGYGTDQAFMRYLDEPVAHRASHVIIGFAQVDIRRIVGRYRGFLSHLEGPWFKPRFVEVGDSLGLLPAPMPDESAARAFLADPMSLLEVGEHDYWYEAAVYENPIYQFSATWRLATHAWIRIRRQELDPNRIYDGEVIRPESEAFRIQLRVMTDFADSVAARGATSSMLMFPSRTDMGLNARGETVSFAFLADSLRARGYTVIDPTADLAEVADISTLFESGGHFSGAGNRIIAETTRRQLGLPPR